MSIGVVFSVFAGFYYWLPKITGLIFPDILGKVHFWILFLGVNLTFFPIHFLGLAGIPRRIPDYPDAYAGWNLVASVGSLISLCSVFFFIYILYFTLTQGRLVGANPWKIKKLL